jgi:predicted transcriptional regulator
MKELAESEIIQLTKDMLYKHHSKTIKNLKKSAHHTEYSSRFQVANQKAVEYQLKSIKELETTIIKLAKETTEFMGDFSSALSDWPVIRSYCKHSMPTFTL